MSTLSTLRFYDGKQDKVFSIYGNSCHHDKDICLHNNLMHEQTSESVYFSLFCLSRDKFIVLCYFSFLHFEG